MITHIMRPIYSRGIQTRNHVKFWSYLAVPINDLISLPRCFIVRTSDQEIEGKLKRNREITVCLLVGSVAWQ